MASEAASLVNEFGHRFGIGKTDEEAVERLAAEFRALGYACRVTDVSVNPRAVREFRISWWWPTRSRARS